MRQDGSGDRVRAQVLIALVLHLVTQVDDVRTQPRDLQRHVDRLLLGRARIGALAERIQELEEARRVELDELLGPQPHGFGTVVRFRGARPGRGTERHLLEQRRRRGEDRRRRRAARGCGLPRRDLGQEITEPRFRPRLRSRQSHPSGGR